MYIMYALDTTLIVVTEKRKKKQPRKVNHAYLKRLNFHEEPSSHQCNLYKNFTFYKEGKEIISPLVFFPTKAIYLPIHVSSHKKLAKRKLLLSHF